MTPGAVNSEEELRRHSLQRPSFEGTRWLRWLEAGASSATTSNIGGEMAACSGCTSLETCRSFRDSSNYPAELARKRRADQPHHQERQQRISRQLFEYFRNECAGRAHEFDGVNPRFAP